MDPFKKRLEDQTQEERMAGLQSAVTGPVPQRVQLPTQSGQMGSTPEEMAKFEAVQKMMLANSPTRGVVQPNAADLAAKDADMQAQMDELGEGVEIPAQPQKRFQRLLGK